MKTPMRKAFFPFLLVIFGSGQIPAQFCANPGFSPQLVSSTIKDLADIEIIDMDLDGDMDIVVASANEDKVSWLGKRWAKCI